MNSAENSVAYKETMGDVNLQGWTETLDRCWTVMPLADGRFLVVHGTRGTFDPKTDFYDTARDAAEAMVKRLTPKET